MEATIVRLRCRPCRSAWPLSLLLHVGSVLHIHSRDFDPLPNTPKPPTRDNISLLQLLPKQHWVYKLAPQLSGKAQQAYAALPVTQKLIHVKSDQAGSLLVAIIDPAGSLLSAKSDPPLQKVIRVQLLVDTSLF